MRSEDIERHRLRGATMRCEHIELQYMCHDVCKLRRDTQSCSRSGGTRMVRPGCAGVLADVSSNINTTVACASSGTAAHSSVPGPGSVQVLRRFRARPRRRAPLASWRGIARSVAGPTAGSRAAERRCSPPSVTGEGTALLSATLSLLDEHQREQVLQQCDRRRLCRPPSDRLSYI